MPLLRRCPRCPHRSGGASGRQLSRRRGGAEEADVAVCLQGACQAHLSRDCHPAPPPRQQHQPVRAPTAPGIKWPATAAQSRRGSCIGHTQPSCIPVRSSYPSSTLPVPHVPGPQRIIPFLGAFSPEADAAQLSSVYIVCELAPCTLKQVLDCQQISEEHARSVVLVVMIKSAPTQTLTLLSLPQIHHLPAAGRHQLHALCWHSPP